MSTSLGFELNRASVRLPAHNNIDFLYSFSKPGLVALENLATMEVWLFYSANILGYLGRLITDNRRFMGFNINILEIWFDRQMSQLFMRQYYDKYRNNGWTILNENPRMLQYKIRVKARGLSSLGVYLTNRGYNPILVGVFKNIREAQPFLDLYKQMKYIVPIYALNEKTREAIKECL